MFNEKPIIFSPNMVNPIDERRKTQTRRIIKTGKESADEVLAIWKQSPDYIIKLMGYGWPGDLLWVRETFLKPPVITPKMIKEGADTWPKFDYVASCSKSEIEQYKEWGWKVKPSIHMPKEAARLWLTIKNLRVERLQDISPEDAIAEGIEMIHENPPVFRNYLIKEKLGSVNPVKSFSTLWRKIHGPKAWDENPWVLVIDFLKGREAGHE